MKRLLFFCMTSAAILAALAGCGSDGDGGGTTPTPVPFTRLVAAHHQNPGLSSVDSPIWDSITAGQIVMGSDTAYNAGYTGAGSAAAQLKALVAGDSLFLRVTWADGSVDNLFGRLHANDAGSGYVAWEGDTSAIYNEDRFYILFDENGSGCKRFCHSAANAIGRKYYGSASDEADVWHWKANRTGLALFTASPVTLGFAEDMHITDTMVASDPQASDNDNLYFDNLNRSNPLAPVPRKMDSTGSAFTGPGLVENRYVSYTTLDQHWIDSSITPYVGKYLPGYYMRNLTGANGSRWDVRALADHDGTNWTVVFCRKLTTSDAGDIDLTSATPDSVLVSIAFGNNSGTKHYGYKPFYLIVE